MPPCGRKENTMILAEKIALLRRQNGWSQEELADQLNVSTPKPFQFNPACSASAPVGNGLMTISLANDDEMMSNYTTAEVMGGDQLNTCFPKIKISYGGYTTEY